MRILLLTLLLIACNLVLIGQEKQELFTLSFEGATPNFQAIAIRENHNEVYLLNHTSRYIIVCSFNGTIIKKYAISQDLTGMCVSERGDIVAFSPMGKYAIGITGKWKGQKFTIPSQYAALSEVWFSNGVLYGRYGWESFALTAQTNNERLPRSVVVSTNEFAVGVAGEEQSCIFKVADYITKSYCHGKILQNGLIAVTLLCKEEQKIRKKIVLCDMEGNISKPITLSNNNCFINYIITTDIKIYEMVQGKKSLTVRVWKSPKVSKQRNVRSTNDSTKLFPKITANYTRRNIYVWFRSTGKVQSVNLEEYLKGVVSKEIYGSWTLEAHKGMAVTARTYAVARYRHSSPKAHVCTTTCCQAWTAHPDPKAIQAVNATAGIYIKKGGKPVTEPLYYSHCNGYTRNSEDYNNWNYVSYLRGVKCDCGWKEYFGHGVGLCQYGMEAFAKKGWSYSKIIAHYYTGCSVGK